ncbi:hypothetical protein PHLCEN_2v2069 [Hermanssonia centrifuga]|uniref:glutathione transferase n=1 Tax=Hermanssonia centrifuga TaxID=98765 RepID=A0A2R6RQ58_9APHY|nr:hypothetical protein PHLCEN_2v2069 [Hermanssonia centrifuga]
MSHGKQFTLYTCQPGGPNGWKVAIVLEELGLTYESIYLDLKNGESRSPEHTKYNPNGRIPTLIDHKNNEFVIWESNAIILYLISKYDPEHKISVTTEGDKFQLTQWLFFQASGQGPYYGQASWFVYSHPEKIESAKERYMNETLRILGVLESVLSKQEWLVGGKATVADLSFITWNQAALIIVLPNKEGFDFHKDFPAVFAWHAKLEARDSVKKIAAVRAAFQR